MTKKRSLKRKLLSDTTQRNSKRQKIIKEDHGIDELDWKVVERPSTAGIDEAGGMLLLEEVEDVEVYYEDTPDGRVAKFRQVINLTEDTSNEPKEDGVEEPQSGDDEQEAMDIVAQEEETFDVELLPEWSEFSLSPSILRCLHEKGFTSPTPIQKQTLPLSLSGKDVIGISQTGSGKTLAFALPIINHILTQAQPTKTHKRQLSALIIAPTRELALQVSSHINACSPKRSEAQIKVHAPPRVSVATIVGGMSSHKQLRVLEKGADIIVATPGRLWELLSEDDQLAGQVRNIQFLVLDEADRMIENGHFAELDKIIRLTTRPEEPEEEDAKEEAETNKLQTFIFSATMSKDLQQNLKRFRRSKSKNAAGSTIDDLIAKLDFRDSEPAVIDLSPQDGVVATLQESKAECLVTDKDAYLYYFLLRYPGRSLVFMTSIDGIRRLTPLLELLDVKIWPLHSQMEQKQRLKNLDRFKKHDKCVLLATDVAARGLDIPFVDHVIHFQVPRSADVYIHRNGRTARAERPGFGLLLCAPDERKLIRSLFGSLKRKEDEVPELPVERDLLDRLKQRVQLAREIDKLQHGATKEKHDENWLKATAEALELELSDDDRLPKGRSSKDLNAKVKAMKRELSELLSEPLIARGVSRKFITSGSRPIVEDLIRGQNHDSFLGLKVVAAQDDIAEQKPNKGKGRGKRMSKKV